MTSEGNWWDSAATYQLYLRSFLDGNSDGNGDLAGVQQRLEYLSGLGVDAIWFNPWYESPMCDGGYDVADYRNIDPVFGTLADAQSTIGAAHDLGLRVIADIVPNHCSDQHAWFVAALAASAGSVERQRFHFRAGRGAHGEQPPNDWASFFGGPAWTRTTDASGSPGEWYLHLFTPGQPDLNWANDEVRREFEEILRFWFDRGVDGFRVDVAMLLAKDPALPDFDGVAEPGHHPYFDRDEVHAIFEGWRRVADSYAAPRYLIGEVWVATRERLDRYLRPAELHSAFNFDFLNCPLTATDLHRVIDAAVTSYSDHGALPTWVLGNHDVPRQVSRYAGSSTAAGDDGLDLAVGRRRARAAAALALSLPGAVFIYQGDELGLEEVADIPDEARQDPIWERSQHEQKGRDGCRVPFPWSGSAPPFGFTSSDVAPWLPQPATWRNRTMAVQNDDPSSTLNFYRHALARRRSLVAPESRFEWVDSPTDVLAFTRGDELLVMVNLGTIDVDLPAGVTVLLASDSLDDDRLPPDSTVWLQIG